MYKKILATLLSLTLAAAFVGCGSDKDSSTESSATEAATEVATEEEQSATEAEQDLESSEAELDANNSELELIEAELDANDVVSTLETADVEELLLSGAWSTAYIADAEGNIFDLEDYCEIIGIEPNDFKMTIEFASDKTLKIVSESATETGTYAVDGISISITLDTDNSESLAVYDEENEIIFIDILGSGQLYFGFTL